MKRILFVDDESQILDGIRRALWNERGRWELHFAAGGEAGLQACERTSFDVIVSDMRMPGMDGATFLGRVRDRQPGAARLILSGYAERSLAARAAAVAYRILAKPTGGKELRDTIERVCTLQDLLCTPELRRSIGAIGALPSLSSTYYALVKAVQDPAIHIARIAEIITQDAAMSARVLQLTNSAFFGLAQRVTNLQSAVGHLGMNTIRDLALVSDTFRVLIPDARIPKAFFATLQLHAHQTAMIAGALSVARGDREVAVVAALLHDIGRLVLASRMPTEFLAVTQYAREHGCEEHEAEREVMGVSHAEIGAYLLGVWGIDQRVVEAIAHHHDPTRISHAGFDPSAVLYIADLLAHRIDPQGQEWNGDLSDADRENLETMGLLAQMPELVRTAEQILLPVAV